MRSPAGSPPLVAAVSPQMQLTRKYFVLGEFPYRRHSQFTRISALPAAAIQLFSCLSYFGGEMIRS